VCASHQARVACDDEEVWDVGKCLLRLLKMPSSRVTSGKLCMVDRGF